MCLRNQSLRTRLSGALTEMKVAGGELERKPDFPRDSEEQGRKDSRSTFPGGTGVDTCFLPPGCSLGRGSESRVEGEGVRCQEGVQLPGKTKGGRGERQLL